MSPFTLESDPIVNHLLIKSKDPQKNTVKKSIHINSPVLSLNEDVAEFNFPLRSSHSESISHLKDKSAKSAKKKPKKQQKPYYSDDEDDDSDEDDELNFDDTCEDEESDDETDREVDTNDQKNLIDIQLDKLGDPFDKNESLRSSSQIVSKESSFNNNSIRLDNDSGFIIQSTALQPTVITKSNKPPSNTRSKAQLDSSSTASSSSSATIINQLINQEKRNLATPVNPFPVRHINSNIARNGVRLGLYK